MADRLRWIVDAFVRDNKVLPPVLAVLALFIIAWILAGAFMGGTDQEPVAHRADLTQSDLAQSDGGSSGGDPAPGVEIRDVNSYAAYRSKDPFRELIAPDATTPEQATPEPTTAPRRPPGGPGVGGATGDKDADGVPDRRERRLDTDPNIPDTDGDGTPDGSDDDANGDGLLDTGGTGAGSGTVTTPGGTPNAGQPGRGGGRGKGGNGGGLLNSGGTLPLP